MVLMMTNFHNHKSFLDCMTVYLTVSIYSIGFLSQTGHWTLREIKNRLVDEEDTVW